MSVLVSVPEGKFRAGTLRRKTRAVNVVQPEELYTVYSAKDYALHLCEGGKLLLARPLNEQIEVAMGELGFRKIMVSHERVHDLWLIRADVRDEMDCTTEQAARKYFRRLAKRICKWI